MVSGARHAADRGLIDRNNVATFTEALTTNYMTHMRSPIVYRCDTYTSVSNIFFSLCTLSGRSL